MKITLRKANALQQAVTEAMTKLQFGTDISINEFQVPLDVIKDAGKKFADNLVRRNKLIDALYEIRREVSRANATSDINDTLAILASTEKQISFYTRLSQRGVQTDMEIITGKLRKIKRRTAEHPDVIYSHDEEVKTSIFNQAEIDGFCVMVNHLKRTKQEMQDALLEMNVRTEFTLSSDVVATLKVEEII
jgi:hypothetical protein